MILYSDTYINQSIKLINDVVTFSHGKCEVSDEVGKEILEAGYANIFSEPKTKLTNYQTELSENHEHIVKSFEAEILRLKNIIISKDETIATLKLDIAEWRKVAGGEKKAEDVVEKTETSIADSLADLTKEALVQLALDQDIIKDAKEFNGLKKSEIVDFITSKLS